MFRNSPNRKDYDLPSYKTTTHQPSNSHQTSTQQSEDGPKLNRSCTDIICILFFLIFWGFIIFSIFVNLKDGESSRILRPVDNYGNQCGFGKASKHKYLFFANIKIGSNLSPLKNSICVNECPSKVKQSLDCHTNPSFEKCDSLTNEAYPTKLRLSRYCIPTEEHVKESLQVLFSVVNYEETFQSLTEYRMVFLYCFLLSILYSNIYSFLLQKCTRIIVIICILGYYLGLIALGYICYHQYRHHKSLEDIAGDKSSKEKQSRTANLYFWGGIGLAVLFVFSLLLMCFFIGKIILATKIIMVSN